MSGLAMHQVIVRLEVHPRPAGSPVSWFVLFTCNLGDSFVIQCLTCCLYSIESSALTVMCNTFYLRMDILHFPVFVYRTSVFTSHMKDTHISSFLYVSDL